MGQYIGTNLNESYDFINYAWQIRHLQFGRSILAVLRLIVPKLQA